MSKTLNQMGPLNKLDSTTSNIASKATSTIKDTFVKTQDLIGVATDAIQNRVAAGKEGTTSFLESNSPLAKLSFVALLIIVLYILVKIISKIMVYFYTRNSTTYLYKDLKSANVRAEITQDASNPNSVLIERSKNRDNGIEFTYSSWINIDSMKKEPKFQSVFVKSNMNNWLKECPNNKDNSIQTLIKELNLTQEDCSGINYPDNGPGLYIFSNPTVNDNSSSLNLLIVMNTFNNIIEYVIVNNISTQKWLNIIIRVSGKNLDVYINGTIVKRHIFASVPKQNYGSVVINGNKGFNGSVSGIKYYNKALNIIDINNIVKHGPNLNTKKEETVTPPFLSQDWYFENSTI